jgi:hypothetical protein
MDSGAVIDAMRTAAHTLRSGDVREQLHAVQAAQDALDAAKAVLLADLRTSKDYELDGASTLNTWVRNQLRMNAGQATALVKNMNALRDLPLVAEAALAGQISDAHVRVFVYGLAHGPLPPPTTTKRPLSPSRLTTESVGPPACPRSEGPHAEIPLTAKADRTPRVFRTRTTP